MIVWCLTPLCLAAVIEQVRQSHKRVRVVRLETTTDNQRIVGLLIPNSAVESVLTGWLWFPRISCQMVFVVVSVQWGESGTACGSWTMEIKLCNGKLSYCYIMELLGQLICLWMAFSSKISFIGLCQKEKKNRCGEIRRTRGGMCQYFFLLFQHFKCWTLCVDSGHFHSSNAMYHLKSRPYSYLWEW